MADQQPERVSLRDKKVLYLSNIPYSLGSVSVGDFLQHNDIDHVRCAACFNLQITYMYACMVCKPVRHARHWQPSGLPTAFVPDLISAAEVLLISQRVWPLPSGLLPFAAPSHACLLHPVTWGLTLYTLQLSYHCQS